MSLSTLASMMLATTSPLAAPVAPATDYPAHWTMVDGMTALGSTDLGSTVVPPYVVQPAASPVPAATAVTGEPVTGVDASSTDGVAPDANAPDASATPAPVADGGTTNPDDGDIVVTGSLRASPADPIAAVNALSYEATQAIDVAVVEPASRAYGSAVPVPIRHGLRNFLVNIHEPIIALNYLLQHKIGKTFETLARFAINTTLGLVGVFDVARREPFNLPHRVNGLGNTLGYYGIGPGPFLYLPLVGPTTVRDLIGGSIDGLAVPFLYGSPFSRPEFSLPTGALHQLEERIAGDANIHHIRDETGDPYTAQREAYLRRRQGEINMLRCGREDCDAAPLGTATPAPAPEPTAPPVPATTMAPSSPVVDQAMTPAPVAMPDAPAPTTELELP